MKFKYSFLSILVGALLTIGAIYPSSDTYEEKEALILHGVINLINQIHVNPKPIDDTFSAEVFDTYLERVDNGKRFLTQDEMNQLSTYKTQIDNQVNDRTLEFFDLSYELVEKGVDRGERIFTDLIENHTFDFEKHEFIELDTEKKEYAKDEQELREVWRKYLKYDIINKIARKKARRDKKEETVDKDAKADKEIKAPLTDEEIIQKSIEETKESFKEWFERQQKTRRSDYFETYIGSITNYFDPHTDYFNPKQKEDFDINMGGKLEGIGARLSLDGDYTKVASIIPGGPAYQNGEIEVDDLIIAVTQEGEEEAIDIVGWRLDDVVQQIRGKKGTIVKLTIQKPDGNIEDIEIERDRVIIDESFARSVKLDLNNTINNVGYIKLPKFYSSFENEGGNSCAVDVAKEIEKLKDENVNAIILDLRNNTGGSLKDVVDMSGLFIEDGPIVQVKPRTREPYVHEDEDDGVLYGGPLIVMVNHLSASASEILAAALQDYGRAIIVGSKSTFGKGSVQRFFDLDRMVNSDEFKPLGNVKVSVQKFYRVNGGSTQLKGVIPDIILPDNYQFIETGEKEYENALEWTQIDPVDYDQNIVRLNHKDKLADLSKRRVEKEENFQLILENAERLKKNRDLSNYPLNLLSYEEMVEQRKEEASKFDELYEDDIQNLSVTNLAVDTAYINSDESRIGRNDEWVKNLKKDFYLEETLHILKDLISIEESYSSLEEKLTEGQNKVIRP